MGHVLLLLSEATPLYGAKPHSLPGPPSRELSLHLKAGGSEPSSSLRVLCAPQLGAGQQRALLCRDESGSLHPGVMGSKLEPRQG